MKSLKVMLILLALSPASALAQGSGVTGTFHGFAFGVFNATESEKHDWSVGHAWLIGSLALGELEALAVVAPEGPPSALHNLQFSWKPKAVAWLDHVTIGRTQPGFGREFGGFRRDLVPTVNYSGITRHMVARDWGIVVGSRVGKLEVTTGAFLGKRTGGNIPASAGCCDLYIRGEYPILKTLLVGASWRGSEVGAVGAHAVWQDGSTMLSAELIRTRSSRVQKGKGEPITEWTFLGEHKIVEGVRAVFRYDDLESKKQTTLGLVLNLGQHVELKAEQNFVANGPDQVLGQLVFRW